MTHIATGANFRIEIIAEVALHRITESAEMTHAEKAKALGESIPHHRSLVEQQNIKGVVIDLRELASVPNPEAQEFFQQILGIWESARRRVAVIINKQTKGPILLMAIERIQKAAAPNHGSIVSSMSDAQLWVAGHSPATLTSGIFYPPK